MSSTIDNPSFLKGTSLEGRSIRYKGSLELLQRRRVSIVGARKPNSYAKSLTHEIASKLVKAGACVVSGGAIGVDAIAHKAAGASNTIMVAATGLDIRYPAINRHLIAEIEQKGLVVSQFEEGTPSRIYNFPLRNELTVALGEVLVVTFAEPESGSVRSIKYAKKLGKEIFVLPHRLGESEATNELLKKGEATAIYDIDAFVSRFGEIRRQEEDELLLFCSKHPAYDEVVSRFGGKVFEYELEGKIVVKEGRVYPA